MKAFPSLFFHFLISIFPTPLLAQLEAWDSDQDAMPNAWEFHRGLDVYDPKDAWQDPDQDGVCNLYEYLLGAHPQDASQPKYLEYDGQLSLEEFIRNAPRGVVLRIPEGEYDLNYQYETYTAPPRVLLQGGWKADFSERDHCRYPTVLNGGKKGPIFNFLIASGNSSVLLIDGMTLKNAEGGAVQFTSYISKSQLLLANCTLVDNAAGRTSAIVRYEDGDFTLISDCIVVNTTIAANKGTGLQVTQRATLTNFKVLHTLIAYNENAENDAQPYSSGYGLRYRPASDSLLHVEVANSILWGNTGPDLWFEDPDLLEVAVDSRNNIYGTIRQDSLSVPFVSKYDRSLDPQLVRGEGALFYLEEGSPAKRAGGNLGFVSTAEPDLGPVPCVDPLSTAVDEVVEDSGTIKIFPNPVDQLLTVNFFLPQPTSVRLIVYDVLGRPVKEADYTRLLAGVHDLVIEAGELEKGMYLIKLAGGTPASFIKY